MLYLMDYQIIEQKENFKEKTKLIKNIIFKTFNQDRRMEWFFSLYYKKLDGLKNLIKKDLYDVVICSRPDYAPKSVFFNSETLDKEKIYLSRLNIENGYHDFFIIGSPQNLLKIFNIYHDINDILIPHVINLGKINEITCGHTLLTHYIDDILKLKENIVEIELNGELVR
jgi:hypothetical protein